MGVGPVRYGKLRMTMAGLVMAGAVAACSPIERYHGFVPPEAEVAALQIGVTTKDEVVSLFGVPAADRALQNNTIYYAASKFERFGPFAPEVVERQVLAVAFDANDRLQNVSRYTLEDGRVIALDRRVTEDGIADVSFLGQLLGSFGRVDAATLLGEPPQ